MSCCDNKGILITLKLSARSSNWWNSPLIHNSSWSGNDSQLPETLEGRKKDYFHRLWSEKKLRLRSKPERRHQKPRSYIKGMSAHAIKRGEESPWTGISNICSQRYVGQSDSCGLNMSHSIFRDLVMREVSACGACNRLWTSPSRLMLTWFKTLAANVSHEGRIFYLFSLTWVTRWFLFILCTLTDLMSVTVLQHLPLQQINQGLKKELCSTWQRFTSMWCPLF